MKSSHTTLGATLIVVVLFTLLILSLVLAATMRLSLTSRQTSGDNYAILQSQYAAESNLSLLRSKMRDTSYVLQASYKAVNGDITPNLQVPAGTTAAQVQAWALQFCGKPTVTSPWISTGAEFQDIRSADDTSIYPAAVQCKVDNQTTLSNTTTASVTKSSFDVLAQLVPTTAFAALPATERPATGTDMSAWWQNYFNVTTGDVRYSISPIRVVKLEDNHYRFYLGINDARVAATTSNATRLLNAKRDTNGDYWFEIVIDSPYKYVKFDNTWSSTVGGWYNDVIDGDYFTNQKPRFYGYGQTTVFKGNVYSAGCGTFPSATAPAGTDCTGKVPGFYAPYNNSQVTTGNNGYITNYMKDFSTMVPGKVANFSAHYTPLPKTADNQEAATDSNFKVASSEGGVELFAGDGNDNPLTTYDTTKTAWKENDPTYQYIKFKSTTQRDTTKWQEVTNWAYSQTSSSYRKTVGSKYYINPFAYTRQFRVDKDGNVFQKNGATWGTTAVATKFNGVIFSDHAITMNGPNRIGAVSDGSVGNVPPALASFSALNVTSKAGVKIDSDLVMSDTPCDNQAFNTCAKNTIDTMPKNVLGIYAPSGDVTISDEAPNDVSVHAAIMASSGGLAVENYDSRPNQGNINLVGSMIDDKALSTGTVNNGVKKGYNTVSTYDNRFKSGILPPFAPMVNSWLTASSTGVTKTLESVIWKQGPN